MNYIKSKAGDLNLGDLPVENIFITECMPEAEGDFIKVYLMGRLYAENDKTISDEDMAALLGISKDRLLEAWNYWEEWGIIKKRYIGDGGRLDFAVEFMSLKEQLYGGDGESKEKEESVVIGSFGNEAVSELMDKIEKRLGRTMDGSKIQSVIKWVDEFKAAPEVIIRAVDYCIAKDKPNFNYIGRVIEGWVEQGLTSADDVDAYLDEYDQKFTRRKRVKQALGLYSLSEEQGRIIDTWFDDWGYNMDKVLEACAKSAGISNPGVAYVNRVLENWKNEAGEAKRDVNDKQPVSNSVLRDYYNYLREKADREAEERRNKVYKEIPKIKEIDDQMKTIGTQLAKVYLSGDDKEGSRLSAELTQLNEDRAYYLAENDYDMDYTDPKYACAECNDTGIAEMGGPCPVCREKRRLEAEEWQREREGSES